MEDNLNEMIEVKLVIVGDIGVGKTTFTRRIVDSYERKYLATIGVERIQAKFLTSLGRFKFNIWDPSGCERYGALRDSF